MATSKNQTTKTVSTPPRGLIIGAVLALLVIALFIFLGPRLIGGPFAGKATQYGAPVGGTVQEQWGVLISDASAGAPWIGTDDVTRYDEVDAIVFVNFGLVGASFSTLRLRLNYNPDVLEPVSTTLSETITPLHSKYQSNLGSEINTDDHFVLGYYTWSGSALDLSDPAISTIYGQQSLFKVRFRVIAPNPGMENEQEYARAVYLEDVSDEVLNNNAGTSYGVYSTASGNEDVQMIAATPNPASLALTVYPGCYDDDGDGYAPTGRDKQACGPLFQRDDCNDENANVRPGGTELCNTIDDDCNQGTPDGSGEELVNTDNQEGICSGLKKQCDGSDVNEPWVNNYATQLGSIYESSETTCDFYDNDCDGNVNEVNDATGLSALSGCSLKVGQIASAVPGNVYIEYGEDDKHILPQSFEISDNLLYKLLWGSRNLGNCGRPGQSNCVITDCGGAGQPSCNCGRAGLPPCNAALDADTVVRYCYNNVYYEVAGGIITKHSAEGNKETVSAVSSCT